MTTKLRSTLAQDGTGTGELMSGRIVVATIHWGSICVDNVCHAGANPADVSKLTRLRLQDEQKSQPTADPRKAKAIALLMQVEAELDGGQKTLDDGTPIFGGSE